MTLKRTRLATLNNYMSDSKEDEKSSSKSRKKNQKQQGEVNPNQLDPIIAKVIKEALMIRLANDSRQTQVEEIDAMVATCQEFMSSFIILGYDINHQPVQPIVFAHNQQEADSLGAYLSKFINHNIKEINP